MPGYPSALFTTHPGVRFECAICLDILKNPQVVCKNGHSFCETCVTETVRTSKKCPSCREPMCTSIRNVTVRDIVDSLEVKCNFVGALCCPWKGPLEARDAHISKDCPLVMVPCPNAGCPCKPSRKDLVVHNRWCLYRKIKCTECPDTILNRDVAPHSLVCSGRKISCSMKCGAKIIFRESAQHKEVCPNALVRCPFHLIGSCNSDCNGHILRHQLGNHMKSSDGSLYDSMAKLVYNNLYTETVNQVLSLQFSEMDGNSSSSSATVRKLLVYLKHYKKHSYWDKIKMINHQLGISQNLRGQHCASRHVFVRYDGQPIGDDTLTFGADPIKLTMRFQKTNGGELTFFPPRSCTISVCDLQLEMEKTVFVTKSTGYTISAPKGEYIALFTLLYHSSDLYAAVHNPAGINNSSCSSSSSSKSAGVSAVSTASARKRPISAVAPSSSDDESSDSDY